MMTALMAVRSRELRVAALLAPLPLAEAIVASGAPSAMIAQVVAVAGLVVAAVVLGLIIVGTRRPPADRGPLLARIDVLTATGATVMAGSMIALIVACVIGWASAAVVGTLGIATVYTAVAWSFVVAAGHGPWRHAVIARAIVPAHTTEGEPLREQVRVAGVTIPIGMRLFVVGEPLRDGATSRYAIGSTESRGTLVLGSELGRAVRGDQRVPAMTLWLGDVLGLTRTPAIERGGGSELVVLPRVPEIARVAELLGAGGDAATAAPTTRLPTEGSFRIRDYAPGDDARRIHWVRTLARDQLTVRLPDEVPPADPEIRVVLDTGLDGVDRLSCRAPHELLDGLVRVWLGLGKALAESGSRVTLVTAAALEPGGSPGIVQRALPARSWTTDWLRLGAAARWQSAIDVRALIQPGARHLVVTSLDRPPAGMQTGTDDVSWVVLPERSWTTLVQPLASGEALRLPFAVGSAENRGERIARARQAVIAQRDDHAMFSSAIRPVEMAAYRGHLVALPTANGAGVQIAGIS